MAKKEYPLEKPKLEYAHEVKGSMKADEITERIPPLLHHRRGFAAGSGPRHLAAPGRGHL